MTETKKDDKPINETIYIPKQQAHQLEGVSCWCCLVKLQFN